MDVREINVITGKDVSGKTVSSFQTTTGGVFLMGKIRLAGVGSINPISLNGSPSF